MKTKELLKAVQKVMPAIDSKSIVAQTDHIIFNDGFLSGYNGRISISTPIDSDLNCSIPAADFLKILKAVETEDVELSVEGNVLHIVSADDVRAAISTDVEEEAALIAIREFVLDDLYDGKGTKIPADLIDGISMCRTSASKNADDMNNLNCICVEDEIIMAGDGYQATLWEMESSMRERVLIPLSSAIELVNFDPAEYIIVGGWMHMIDQEDSVFSVRVVEGTFPRIAKVIDSFKSEATIKLPIKMQEVAKAFGDIAESPVENFKIIQVDVMGDIIECSVEKNGVSATKSIPFEGNTVDVSFMISSMMLCNILNKTTEMEISTAHARFVGEQFNHLITLVQQK